MSQEYTEDKHIKFRKISSGRRLLEAVLIVIGLCAVFLLVALLSFNPSDPSWSQTTWHEPVKNLAGSIGAWFADILFSAFGILAYTVPPLMILGAGRPSAVMKIKIMWTFSHSRCVSSGADSYPFILCPGIPECG